jgi:hypothetical protein
LVSSTSRQKAFSICSKVWPSYEVYGEEDGVDVGRHPRQVDEDRLVVAVAVAGAVVAVWVIEPSLLRRCLKNATSTAAGRRT